MEALDFVKHNDGTNQIQHRNNMAKRQESLPAIADHSMQCPFTADGGGEATDEIADPVGHEEHDQKDDSQSAFHTAVLLRDAYLNIGNDEPNEFSDDKQKIAADAPNIAQCQKLAIRFGAENAVNGAENDA